MNRTRLSFLCFTAAAVFIPSVASGSTIVPGFDSNSLAANDDGSTGILSIGFTVNFFGNTYGDLWVNNNGNVTFDAPLSTYTPFDLYTAGRVIIAPFFGDVDTRGSGSALTTYGTGTYGSHNAFGATWDGVGVGYFAFGTDKLNQFQLLLVERADVNPGDFDIYFNYDQIQWETGGASGGSGGLGGASARAGYSNGLAIDSYELPGSAVNGAFLDSGPLGTALIHNSNVGVDGRFCFAVRNGIVVEPPTAPEAGTSAAATGLMTVFGVQLLSRRVRRTQT